MTGGYPGLPAKDSLVESLNMSKLFTFLIRSFTFIFQELYVVCCYHFNFLKHIFISVFSYSILLYVLTFSFVRCISLFVSYHSTATVVFLQIFWMLHYTWFLLSCCSMFSQSFANSLLIFSLSFPDQPGTGLCCILILPPFLPNLINTTSGNGRKCFS